MKKSKNSQSVQITNQEVEEYALRMTTSESETVQKLVASSDEELEYIDMLSGNLVGQLLKMLIKISGAKRVLEIGTFTGYSALMMAEALPDDGELITVEMNLRYQELAEEHFKKYDHQRIIKLIKGDAREELQNLEGIFDLVFIDADKLSYPNYFEMCLKKMEAGALLIVDNVLWGGTVLDPQDHKAESLNGFNEKVYKDKRVEQVLLPIRDGITVIRKK